MTLAPLYLDFKLKSKWIWLKLKMDPGPTKKFRPGPEKKNYSGPGLGPGLGMPAGP